MCRSDTSVCDAPPVMARMFALACSHEPMKTPTKLMISRTFSVGNTTKRILSINVAPSMSAAS